MNWFACFAFCVSFAFNTLPIRAADAADPAVRQITAFYDALTNTMKNGGKLGMKGRYDALLPVIRQTFDIPAMAQLSVGPAWQMMTEKERTDITAAFERMTVANYAKNFASYSGERFDVQPTAQTRNGDKIVGSTLVGSDHSTVPFNYRMHDTGGSWKAVDIYLNGYVSQLAVRRSDFASTVAKEGASGLIKKIDELSNRILGG